MHLGLSTAIYSYIASYIYTLSCTELEKVLLAQALSGSSKTFFRPSDLFQSLHADLLINTVATYYVYSCRFL